MIINTKGTVENIMITFKPYSQSATREEQIFIMGIFTQLLDQSSYYYNLQLTYNSHHSQICTMEDIYNIAKASVNPYDIIEVQGTVHSNSHSSQLLLAKDTMKSLFVKDTYIRVKYNGSIYHILTYPPIVNTYDYVYVTNTSCDESNIIIEPVVEIN
jgi:hypothetical protein